MNEPSDASQSDLPGASDAPATRRLVLARPHPDETVEEFSARFFAELLDAQRPHEPSDSDGA
jgi:hypothetical protein